MKVLLINGSPHAEGCTYTALMEAASTLEQNGIETELFQIGTDPIAGCIACYACYDTGSCVFEDKVTELAARLDEFDGFIVGSPVYYAGINGQLKCFLDRLFYFASKEMMFKPAACIVSCRRGGSTAAYDQLHKYFTKNNMPLITSQYWNQIHGNEPEEAMQDLEGLQTMRMLGSNMAWILKCIEAGKNAGVEMPKRERWIPTNFIR